MSTIERNKGSLYEIGFVSEMKVDMDDDEFYDFLNEKGLLQIGDKIYTVNWEVKSEKDCSYFEEVFMDDDGIIHFHTLHYNGGGSLEEVLCNALKHLEG